MHLFSLCCSLSLSVSWYLLVCLRTRLFGFPPPLWFKTKWYWDIKLYAFPQAWEWVKWVSEQTNERSGAREQGGVSKWVSGVRERTRERASGPVLTSRFFTYLTHWPTQSYRWGNLPNLATTLRCLRNIISKILNGSSWGSVFWMKWHQMSTHNSWCYDRKKKWS